MAKKEKEPLSVHNINLFAGDYDRIQAHYAAAGASAGYIIRRVVRKFIMDTIEPHANRTPIPLEKDHD